MQENKRTLNAREDAKIVNTDTVTFGMVAVAGIIVALVSIPIHFLKRRKG